MSIKKEKLVFGGLATLLLLFLIYEAIFFEPHIADNHMAHHNDMHTLMAGRMGPSLLGFNILFWFLILGLGYFLIKGSPKQAKKESEALMVLKQRYANGEISREEYLQMFKDLKER
jgi:uncharacterized membrane protein